MNRVEYLDRAKALGMFLIYYVHFAEQLARNHYDAALPLEILNKMATYTSGFPALNGVTWFLVCLFSLEMIVSIIHKKFVLNWRNAVAVSAASFLVSFFVIVPLGVFWYIGEALVVMSFYLTGYLLRKILVREIDMKWAMLSFFLLGGILFLSFDVNKGPFPAQFPVVMLALLSHGNPWYFLLTAFAGIFAVLALSSFLRIGRRPFRFVSENLLIFLGLNGICFHFLNQYPRSRVGSIPDTGSAVFLFSSVYVLAVIALFSPIVMGIRRWVLELAGYPWASHSLIPPVNGWFAKRIQENVEVD